MELIIAIICLSSVFLGYRMGKGEELKLTFPIKNKFIIRSEAQEAKLEQKLKEGKEWKS